MQSQTCFLFLQPTHPLALDVAWLGDRSQAERPFYFAIVKLNLLAVPTYPGTERQCSLEVTRTALGFAALCCRHAACLSCTRLRRTRQTPFLEWKSRLFVLSLLSLHRGRGGVCSQLKGRQWLQYQAFRSPMKNQNPCLREMRPRDLASIQIASVTYSTCLRA